MRLGGRAPGKGLCCLNCYVVTGRRYFAYPLSWLYGSRGWQQVWAYCTEIGYELASDAEYGGGLIAAEVAGGWRMVALIGNGVVGVEHGVNEVVSGGILCF